MDAHPQGQQSSPAQKPRHRRRRTLSLSIPPNGKIAIAVLSSTSKPGEKHAAAGAFTLTGCARAALLGLAPAPDEDMQDANNRDRGAASATRKRARSSYGKSPWAEDVDSPPASPTCSVASGPSITRTASPFEGGRGAIPPGWGARGGYAQREEKGQERPEHTVKGLDGPHPNLHPVLDTLERRSRVGTGRVVCGACGKPGANFPRCPRCTQMWCSRPCRMAPIHQCGPRRTQTE
ncbi:hypothetical protein DFH07DRAFT_588294 [Mycena maculata]|uniref:HIT-type domain-containing protein n=1 Tax=Mycena maculata TaxID=230809 RepID=A0AAD7IPA3_9AGAR|nr:hypothetical protein DFH07DRAFT_588294 [Mycena maculata]